MDNCKHNLRIGDLCADCGEIIKDTTKLYNALHSTDDLRVTESMALLQDTLRLKKLRRENKLVLVLDLDQTILHTTTSKEYIEGVDNFVLDGLTYNVKTRPFSNHLLESVYERFEIHVYTMGTKRYAEKICRIIDPLGKYFDNRVISRSVNNGEYVKNLNRLFCIHENVIILDDRADVWDYSKNLLMVKPFFYWSTGDPNDPKALQGGKETLYRGEPMTKDKVLLLMTETLLDIHKKFYSGNYSDVRDLLEIKKNIFKGRKFFIEGDLALNGLIEMHGGKIVRERFDCDIIVRGNRSVRNKSSLEGSSGAMAVTSGTPVVSFEYVLNSIFRLELEHLDFYVLEILKEDDEIDEIVNDLEGNLF